MKFGAFSAPPPESRQNNKPLRIARQHKKEPTGGHFSSARRGQSEAKESQGCPCQHESTEDEKAGRKRENHHLESESLLDPPIRRAVIRLVCANESRNTNGNPCELSEQSSDLFHSWRSSPQ